MIGRPQVLPPYSSDTAIVPLEATSAERWSPVPCGVGACKMDYISTGKSYHVNVMPK